MTPRDKWIARERGVILNKLGQLTKEEVDKPLIPGVRSIAEILDHAADYTGDDWDMHWAYHVGEVSALHKLALSRRAEPAPHRHWRSPMKYELDVVSCSEQLPELMLVCFVFAPGLGWTRGHRRLLGRSRGWVWSYDHRIHAQCCVTHWAPLLPIPGLR